MLLPGLPESHAAEILTAMNNGAGRSVDYRDNAKSGLRDAEKALIDAVAGLDRALEAIRATMPPDDGTMFTPPPVTTDPSLYENLENVTRLGEESRVFLGPVAAANAGVQALPPVAAVPAPPNSADAAC